MKNENGRIINDDGLVAITYFQTVPQTVQVPGGAYFFGISRNICLAWVKPEHVDMILAMTKSCCGGRVSRPFRLASLQQANIWSNISERG